MKISKSINIISKSHNIILSSASILMTFLLLIVSTEGAFGQSYLQYADSADNYISKREWSEAERCIEAALRIEPANPGNPLLITNLGIVRNHREKYREAIESFDIALSRMPSSTVALTGRAEAYIALGENSAALSDLNKAIEVDSTLTLPLTMKGYLLLRQNKPQDGLIAFRKLIELDKFNAIGYAGTADCLTNLGENTEAIGHYLKALEIEDRPEWRFRAGLLMLDQNDLEGAAEQGRLVLSSNPKNGDIYILIALLHKKRYESREAEIAEKMAREFEADPELIEIYLK